MVKISVVMSVYNGGAGLASTVDSILAQTEGDFELIVIDDGSTDGTPSILDAYARRDARVRVLHQPNTGLTRALIRGCEEARADVIARHDAGDRSHPERFARQLDLLRREGHAVVSCATRTVSPEGDTLYVTRLNGGEVRRSLLEDDAASIHGIVHASAMFRRDAYRAAGGYRPQFRAAQDLDLWVRIARDGTFGIVDEELYDSVFAVGSISASSRDAQVRLTRIIVALRDGGDADALLAEASEIRHSPPTRRGEAAALYFIGKCLLQQGNAKGRDYLRRAVARDPLNGRAWVSWLIGR